MIRPLRACDLRMCPAFHGNSDFYAFCPFDPYTFGPYCLAGR
jgi:hypothetical protein